jgi:hypothetical protein
MEQVCKLCILVLFPLILILALNNVLHVPEISKHLLFVHKLARDNNIFFEFHLDIFS